MKFDSVTATDWLCFDLGGVLLDDRQTLPSMVRLVAEVVGCDLEEAWQTRRREGSILGTLRAFCTDDKEAEELIQRYREEIAGVPEALGSEPYPDVKPALERLSRHYHLALASNTPGTARPWLRLYNLIGYFSHLHLADEVGCRKPQAKFFSSMLSRLGVSAERTVMIGDRTDTDCAPALAAGMRTVLIRRHSRELPGYEGIKGQLLGEIADLGELAHLLLSPSQQQG